MKARDITCVEETDIYKNFAPRDLLYGLQSSRASYIGVLTAKAGEPVTIDAYNNRLLIAAEASELDHSISPKKRKRYFDTLASAPDTLRVKPEQSTTVRLKNACKAAVLVSESNIHFLLDGIDPLVIFNKQDMRYSSFTSEELRFIFSHFDVVGHRIRFYYKGIETMLYQWLKGSNQAAINAFYDHFEHAEMDKRAPLAFAALNRYQSIPMMRPLVEAGSVSSIQPREPSIYTLFSDPTTPAKKRPRSRVDHFQSDRDSSCEPRRLF